jgi:hypothetical protein
MRGGKIARRHSNDQRIAKKNILTTVGVIKKYMFAGELIKIEASAVSNLCFVRGRSIRSQRLLAF